MSLTGVRKLFFKENSICVIINANELEEEVRGEGYYVRPRFSPGYGDFSLEVQSAFLEMTDATKLIGITLTDGGIMVPEKSVTAVIGLTKTDKRG